MNSQLVKEKTIGILLMAYGSPESIDDLEAYLIDIRGGRETPPNLVAEIKERYKLIGGKSPLLDLTRLQANGLEAELNSRSQYSNTTFRVYLGMRHWEPRIKEAVAQITADGITTVVAIVMAPHSSQMSTGAYFRKLDEAIKDLGADLKILPIENWHEDPGLIEALAEKADTALRLFEDEQPYVIFSAHSLPARILDQGDAYDVQLHETAELLAGRLKLKQERWQFAFQSAGQSSDVWLGPPIEKVVVELAQRGERNILVVPIGFVCDHVEILYDIDINCRELAAKNGARLERSESLNASVKFISTLANLTLERIAQETRTKEL